MILLAAICAMGFSSMPAKADPIRFAGNGHWYEFVRVVLTWDDARAAALAANHNGSAGYLATITSQDENDFVWNLLAGAGVAGAWLGGTDAVNEGNFIWADGPEAGQAFGYTNWDAAEPNNCCGGEDYVHMTSRQQGGWNDLANDGRWSLSGYVVEYNAVSEPGTLALLGIGLFGIGLARRRTKA